MPVYKPKGRDHYVIDFQLGGLRFCISTKATTKRAAQDLEQGERDKAKELIAREKAAAAAFRGEAPLTMALAVSKYWDEAGQHQVNAATTWTDLNRALAFFGADRRIADIRDAPTCPPWSRSGAARRSRAGRRWLTASRRH